MGAYCTCALSCSIPVASLKSDPGGPLTEHALGRPPRSALAWWNFTHRQSQDANPDIWKPINTCDTMQKPKPPLARQLADASRQILWHASDLMKLSRWQIKYLWLHWRQQMRDKKTRGVKACFCLARGVISSIAVIQRPQRLEQECTGTCLRTQNTEVACLWPTSLFCLFSNPLSSSFPFIAFSRPPAHSPHLPLHSSVQCWCVVTWKQPWPVCLRVCRRERERHRETEREGDREKSGRDNGVVPCSVNDTPPQNRSNTQLLYNFLWRN